MTVTPALSPLRAKRLANGASGGPPGMLLECRAFSSEGLSQMTEVTSVDHIIIAVRDLKEAEKNYTAIFGRAPSWKGVHPGVGTGNVLYRLANTYVELYAPVAEGANAEALKAHLDAHGEGLYGIVLGVDDAAAASTAF